MNKRYKIVITEYCVEEKPAGKQWEEGAGEDGKSYGYTPEIIRKTVVERDIYSQDIEELDLKAVIQAVNEIE